MLSVLKAPTVLPADLQDWIDEMEELEANGGVKYTEIVDSVTEGLDPELMTLQVEVLQISQTGLLTLRFDKSIEKFNSKALREIHTGAL